MAGGPGFDLAGITNTVGAPFLRVFCEGRESGMPAPRGLDHMLATKSNGIRSIAAHPFGSAQGRLLQKAQGWGTLSGNGARKDR